MLALVRVGMGLLPRSLTTEVPTLYQSIEVTIMTRKDYVLIAEVFKAVRGDIKKLERTDTRSAEEQFIAHSDLAYDLAEALEGDNPNFDRAKFLKACRVQQ